jgi:hypothetical protein
MRLEDSLQYVGDSGKFARIYNGLVFHNITFTIYDVFFLRVVGL